MSGPEEVGTHVHRPIRQVYTRRSRRLSLRAGVTSAQSIGPNWSPRKEDSYNHLHLTQLPHVKPNNKRADCV